MIKKVFFVLGIIGLSFQPSAAQGQNSDPELFWFSAGFGGYYADDESGGFSGNISGSYYYNRTLYTVHFLTQNEFNLFGPDPSEEFYHTGMLMGKGYSGKYFQCFVSGGLGVTTGIMRGKLLYTEEPDGWFLIDDPRHFERKRIITPSLPLRIDLLLKPVKFTGAGLSFYTDLNYRRPMAGFLVTVGIGKMYK